MATQHKNGIFKAPKVHNNKNAPHKMKDLGLIPSNHKEDIDPETLKPIPTFDHCVIINYEMDPDVTTLNTIHMPVGEE